MNGEGNRELEQEQRAETVEEGTGVCAHQEQGKKTTAGKA